MGVRGGENDRRLLDRCLAGDAAAIHEFQVQFGELIYGYPQRVYGVSTERAGDFYLFALEDGRVFRRAQSFAGRTMLRSYLAGFVLDHLMLEWKRGQERTESVWLEYLDELPAAPQLDSVDSERVYLPELLAGLDPPKTVLLKLLYIEDWELSAAEVRYLCSSSGRSVRQIVTAVEKLREAVREREAAMHRAATAADGVHSWIQLYERRLRRIEAELQTSPTEALRLRAEKFDLERKLDWRRRQRAAVLARAQRRKVTAPYKSIAEILNTSIGNVSSQILRLRQELATRGVRHPNES